MYSSSSDFCEKTIEVKISVTVDSSSNGKTIHLFLIEDRNYEKETIVRILVEEAGVTEDYAKDLYRELARFLKEAYEVIRGIATILYGQEILMGITLPRVTRNRVNPGEIVGDFAVRRDFVLHICPKIGWTGFNKMFNEVQSMIISLISDTGIIEPFINNLYLPLPTSLVSYSILLNKLTELILNSTPPIGVSKITLISESEVGKPVVSKSIKYVQQGVPLGVFERTCAETLLYPYMLLAKFHFILARTMNSVMNTVSESNFTFFIKRVLEILINSHISYLTNPVISHALNTLRYRDVPDYLLLSETRRFSRVNPYLGLLADLYEMFISKTSLIHMYVSKGLVVPVTSCKVYELWILTKIIEYLRKCGVNPRVVSYGNLFVEFKANDIEIVYNKPLAGQVFIDKLTGSRLRPDFVIKHGDVVVVYDAKYKKKLSKEDVDSMSTYIIELSEPISSLNNMTLVGGFYKLRRDSGRDESPLCRVIESKGTNAIINICIEVNSLDPRDSYNVVEQVLENSLRNYLHTGQVK